MSDKELQTQELLVLAPEFHELLRGLAPVLLQFRPRNRRDQSWLPIHRNEQFPPKPHRLAQVKKGGPCDLLLVFKPKKPLGQTAAHRVRNDLPKNFRRTGAPEHFGPHRRVSLFTQCFRCPHEMPLRQLHQLLESFEGILPIFASNALQLQQYEIRRALLLRASAEHLRAALDGVVGLRHDCRQPRPARIARLGSPTTHSAAERLQLIHHDLSRLAESDDRFLGVLDQTLHRRRHGIRRRLRLDRYRECD